LRAGDYQETGSEKAGVRSSQLDGWALNTMLLQAGVVKEFLPSQAKELAHEAAD
jgi:hypothetical protein